MKKFLIVLLLVFFSFEASAAVMEHPYRMTDEVDILRYSRLTKQKKMQFFVFYDEQAGQFMSEDELFRYFKLKMRNFVREITVVGKDEKKYQSWGSLNLNLYRYNDKRKIYYGLLSFRINPFLLDGDRYELTVAIAGHEEQIVDEIKRTVDQMVETYADDHYYMRDLVHKHNKGSKKKKRVKK